MRQSLFAPVQRQVRKRPWLPAAAIAVLVNVVLLAAYVWSRGGQVTDLRIEVVASEFTVFVDGRERLRESLPSAPVGGVRVHAPDRQFDPATKATKAKIESIRITSADGAVLYESSDATDLGATVDLATKQWTNYTVDVRYQNVMTAAVDVRVQGDDAVTASFQYFGGGFLRLSSSQSPPSTTPTLLYLEPDPAQGAKGATATALKAYPLALGLVLMTLFFLWVRGRFRSVDKPVGNATWLRHVPTVTAAVLAVMVVGITGFVLRGLLDGAVNVADEAAYLFQARILASGRTYLQTPPIPEAFQFYSDPISNDPWIRDYDGRWASFYPLGQPLALVPGVLFGAPSVMPPLLAGANVILLYATGRRMYGPWTAAIAAAFLACSPLFLMQASTFMAHNTTTAFMLASVLSAISFRDRPMIAGSLAGVFFGLMFLTRPLPALAFALPLGALLLARAMPLTGGRERWHHLLAFMVAGAVMVGLYLAYNGSITGNPLQSGYTSAEGAGDAFGFGGKHSVGNGVGNEVWNLVALGLVLNGWPAWLGFALVFVPFMLGTRHGFDWFLLAASLLLIASASLSNTTGMYNGPRYVYEALPFLILLTARGLVCLFEPPRVAPADHQRSPAPGVVTPVRAIAAVVVAVLVAMSATGWLFSSRTEQEFLAIPPSASSMDDYRALDTRLIDQASDADVHDALIFVHVCDPIRNCYLSTFLENDLSLDGDIVWVADRGPEANRDLHALYPCRSLYFADYDRRTLVPAGMTPPARGESCGGG